MNVKMKVVQGKPHGSYLDFPEGEFVVGRGPECHVRPNSELISRQHCMLLISGRAVRVRDLGSTNGTLVNGKRVVEECALCNGDTLQLGPLVLEVVLPEPEAPPQPQEETAAFDTFDTECHATIEANRP
jgi:pSer/pThr/pTyr-binding forkhead associated (FHA) protein